LLLALGDKDNILESLLPFARKKRDDFWVWEILAEAFSSDPDKVFACYCKALSCQSPEEMLVSLRQKMAGILISNKLYNEAKTEIELLVNTRNSQGFKIPNELINWQSQDWYKKAIAKKSNYDFYRQYAATAESLLFSDVPEETVIVDFVNTDRKIANFIASESKFGFFKYERFIKTLQIGDTVRVRFNGNGIDRHFQIVTLVKIEDSLIKEKYLKEFAGLVRINEGQAFGFVGDYFVHPNLIKRYHLINGQHVSGKAICSFNAEKKEWGWKVFEMFGKKSQEKIYSI
jgi:hypothetical protein